MVQQHRQMAVELAKETNDIQDYITSPRERWDLLKALQCAMDKKVMSLQLGSYAVA